jgi:hypothetical protein
MSFLDVPGARLYYEVRGSGPSLFVIGSTAHAADSTASGRAVAAQ